MARPPRELAEGEPLSASWLNQFVAYLKSCGISIDPGSGIVGSKGPNGWSIGFQDTPTLWIKLTYAQGTPSNVTPYYSWIEQVPAPGGGWIDGPRRGYAPTDPARGSNPPDPAVEANRNYLVPLGKRAEASRDAAVGRLTFRYGYCSGEQSA